MGEALFSELVQRQPTDLNILGKIHIIIKATDIKLSLSSVTVILNFLN